jgi:hypothetical protein
MVAPPATGRLITRKEDPEMKIPARSALAFGLAVAVLTVASVAAARTPSPSAQPIGIEDGGSSAGDPSAMCLQGVTDCDDVVIGDGQTSPGSDGDGSPPSTGSGEDPPCGVEVVEGTGPDATVSFTPCEEPNAPIPTDPVITEPTPGMANVRARPFDAATVDADGRTVTIEFVSGIEPCTVLDHIDVAYGTDTVTITLFEGSDPDAGDVACIDIGVFKRTVVVLDQPLGDRTVVDGAL